MRLSLKLVNGQQLKFQVNKDVAIIGRSSTCDIVIPHEGMSRQHCRIEVIGSDVLITDLGSTNGVIIDGTLIQPQTPTKFSLYHSLSFGAVLTALVELEEAEPIYDAPIELEIPKKRDLGKAKKYQAKVSNEPPEKFNLQYFMSNILALLVLAGAFYIYHVMKKSDPHLKDKIQSRKASKSAKKAPAKAEEFY